MMLHLHQPLDPDFYLLCLCYAERTHAMKKQYLQVGTKAASNFDDIICVTIFNIFRGSLFNMIKQEMFSEKS